MHPVDSYMQKQINPLNFTKMHLETCHKCKSIWKYAIFAQNVSNVMSAFMKYNNNRKVLQAKLTYYSSQSVNKYMYYHKWIM